MQTQTFVAPADFICPIFSIQTKGDRDVLGDFLGTGFFLSDPKVFVTCAHVIRNETRLAISHCPSGMSYRTSVLAVAESTDLALMNVDRYYPAAAAQITKQIINTNHLVSCYDYSTVRRTSGETFPVNPATRIGNVTRLLRREDRDVRFDQALEVSFPILHGASGAPILGPIGINDFALLGVGFGNVQYEAKPAVVYETLDEQNEIFEQVQYMLPLGVAINRMHLVNLLEKETTFRFASLPR